MTVKDFLSIIFEDAKGWLCLATIDRMNKKNFTQEFFLYPKRRTKALNFIRRSNTFGMDIYFCPTLLSEPSRKKEYVLPSRVLYADLDECHPRHLGRYGEPKPNLVVRSSSNRWQAYWFLDSLIEPTRLEELNKRIAVGYRDLGVDQGGWDLTQLLRIPTFNWKRVKLNGTLENPHSA